MPCIDPDSPQTETRCYCGEIHQLGDTDCGDYYVGWIENDCTYEDERERDEVTTAGAYREAWRRWNRAGGVLGPEPDPQEFAERLCRNPAHVDEAARHAAEMTDPTDPLNRLLAAYQARNVHLN